MGCLTAFDPLSIDMYLPAFQNMQSDLRTSYASIELSLSSFFIGMAFGQMIYGPLTDRHGRKLPLMAGMALYAVASLACAFATNVETLIGLRLLQAFGGCAGMVITRAIVRDVFDARRSAEFFSSMTLIFGLAPILAPTIGGFVNHVAGWRAIFLLLGGLNVLCLAAMFIWLPETHHGPSQPLTARSVLRGYLHLLIDGNFVGYVIPDSMIRAGMFAYIAGSPFVFLELYHLPPQHYGWLFGTNAIGFVAMSQLNRLLLRRWTPTQILTFARYAALTAGLILFVTPTLTTSVFGVIVPLFTFVASLGLIGPNSAALALANQGHRAGMASALYGTLQWSFAMVSSFAVSRLHNETLYPMTSVMLGCAVVSVVGYRLLVGPREKASITTA